MPKKVYRKRRSARKTGRSLRVKRSYSSRKAPSRRRKASRSVARVSAAMRGSPAAANDMATYKRMYDVIVDPRRVLSIPQPREYAVQVCPYVWRNQCQLGDASTGQGTTWAYMAAIPKWTTTGANQFVYSNSTGPAVAFAAPGNPTTSLITQSPAATDFNDAALKSVAVYLKYSGAWASAKGRVFVGSLPYAAIGTLSPNNLSQTPGMRELSLAEIQQQEICVVGDKVSPGADDFFATNIEIEEFNVPIVMWTNFASDGGLIFDCVMTFDARIKPSATNSYTSMLVQDSNPGHLIAYNRARHDWNANPSSTYIVPTLSAKTLGSGHQALDMMGNGLPPGVGYPTATQR